jgi:transposase
MKMPKSYKFSQEQIAELHAEKKKNKDKNVDRRLRALLQKAEGKKNEQVAISTQYNRRYVSELVSKYHTKGISAITETKRIRRGNLTRSEENALLAEFEEKAQAGQVITVAEIKAAYDEKIGRISAPSIIYKLLKRHNWRKVMPRSKHPKKAGAEAIKASKKLNQNTKKQSRNIQTNIQGYA